MHEKMERMKKDTSYDDICAAKKDLLDVFLGEIHLVAPLLLINNSKLTKSGLLSFSNKQFSSIRKLLNSSF